jgi:dTMP kinase
MPSAARARYRVSVPGAAPELESAVTLTPSPLIVFAGVDGAGKTTHAVALVEWLNGVGVPATLVPNEGMLALRQTLTRVAKGVGLEDYGELVGAFAYRFAVAVQKWSLYRGVGELAQAGGRVLVLDRYYYCQYAGAVAAGLDDRERTIIEGLFRGCPRPAVTFYLHLPAGEAHARFAARGHEQADVEEFAALDAAYRSLPEARGFVLVDSSRPIDVVADEIRREVVQRCFPEWERRVSAV